MVVVPPSLKGDAVVSAFVLGVRENNGFWAGPSVVEAGAGFWVVSFERFENRPPALGCAGGPDGLAPNRPPPPLVDSCCADVPNREPVVAVVEGGPDADEVLFNP